MTRQNGPMSTGPTNAAGRIIRSTDTHARTRIGHGSRGYTVLSSFTSACSARAGPFEQESLSRSTRVIHEGGRTGRIIDSRRGGRIQTRATQLVYIITFIHLICRWNGCILLLLSLPVAFCSMNRGLSKVWKLNFVAVFCQGRVTIYTLIVAIHTCTRLSQTGNVQLSQMLCQGGYRTPSSIGISVVCFIAVVLTRWIFACICSMIALAAQLWLFLFLVFRSNGGSSFYCRLAPGLRDTAAATSIVIVLYGSSAFIVAAAGLATNRRGRSTIFTAVIHTAANATTAVVRQPSPAVETSGSGSRGGGSIIAVAATVLEISLGELLRSKETPRDRI